MRDDLKERLRKLREDDDIQAESVESIMYYWTSVKGPMPRLLDDGHKLYWIADEVYSGSKDAGSRKQELLPWPDERMEAFLDWAENTEKPDDQKQ